MSDKKLTIEDLIDELEQLLAWFDSDNVTVEQSLKNYERAQELVREIETLLTAAKNQITKIDLKFNAASGKD